MAVISTTMMPKAKSDAGWRQARGSLRILETYGSSLRLLAASGDSWRLLETPGGSWRVVAPEMFLGLLR